MAGRFGTGVAVIFTAVVTAALTSAVWLVIFNLEKQSDIEPAPTEAASTVPAVPVPPAAPVGPSAATSERALEPQPALPASTVAADPALQADYEALREKRLTIPVAGVTASQLANTFGDERGGGARSHQALDILAPRGTPVVAVEDGRIEKLFTSKPGGLTIYQFDPSRQYSYYYAHLDRYADGIAEGQTVKRGTIIGYVGSTGNASPDGPHLHFAIAKLGPEQAWYKGTPLNPYPVLGGRPGTEATALGAASGPGTQVDGAVQ